MYICNLINNPTFSFNVPFRIYWRVKPGTDLDVFDSTVSADIDFDLMFRPIESIETDASGVLKIVFSECV